jgi:arylformamidase
MQIYDISVMISTDMPVWPGDPEIHLEQVSKIEEGADANLTRVDMSLHTGTHVDAPYHFLKKGKGVETLPLQALTGRTYVLHLPDVDVIDAQVLSKAEIPPRTRRLLFRTRNSEYWAKGESDFQKDYVGIDSSGAEYLVQRGLKLVGVDYLSVAPFEETRQTHEILLKAGIVIVEGLDLSRIAQGRYTLYCLPLKIKGVDGAPARVILIGV